MIYKKEQEVKHHHSTKRKENGDYAQDLYKYIFIDIYRYI